MYKWFNIFLIYQSSLTHQLVVSPSQCSIKILACVPGWCSSPSQHSINDWERLDNQYCGWLSPIEIDEANDPIGAEGDPVGRRASRKGIVAMSLARYLELLDWMGRTIRSDKRSAIPEGFAPMSGYDLKHMAVVATSTQDGGRVHRNNLRRRIAINPRTMNP